MESYAKIAMLIFALLQDEKAMIRKQYNHYLNLFGSADLNLGNYAVWPFAC